MPWTYPRVVRALRALRDATGNGLRDLAAVVHDDAKAVLAVLEAFARSAVAIAEGRDDDAHALLRDLFVQLAAIRARTAERRAA